MPEPPRLDRRVAERAGQMTGAGKHLPAWVALAAIGAALAAGFLPVLWLGLADGAGRLRCLCAARAAVHAAAGGPLDAPVPDPRTGPGAGAGAAGFPGPRPGAAASQPAAGPASHRRHHRHRGVYGAAAGWAAPSTLYGLQGILLAHVFFNAPLAARLLLARAGAHSRRRAGSWRRNCSSATSTCSASSNGRSCAPPFPAWPC